MRAITGHVFLDAVLLGDWTSVQMDVSLTICKQQVSTSSTTAISLKTIATTPSGQANGTHANPHHQRF